MYEYKTIPCPPVVAVKNKRQDAEAVALYGKMMNGEAANGWEFHSMEPVTVTEPHGCLSLRRSRETTYYIMVFRRAG